MNGLQTPYLLDGDNIVQESTGGTATNLLQGPGTDNLIERGSQWYLPCSLGSTSTLVDGSGNIQQRYYYQPFGQASIQGGGTATPYQFTGREADESGLMYYRARYYNPSWGRFVSVDPAGFKGGIDPYAYCRNNPVSGTDPSGKTTPWQWFMHLLEGFARWYQQEGPTPRPPGPGPSRPGIRGPGPAPRDPPPYVVENPPPGTPPPDPGTTPGPNGTPPETPGGTTGSTTGGTTGSTTGTTTGSVGGGYDGQTSPIPGFGTGTGDPEPVPVDVIFDAL